ncbi:MAG: DM13 domain-containing protein [Acidimicrobiales bacterium]
MVGVALILVAIGLVIAEPAILEAPFENALTAWFAFGGLALGAFVFLVMLRHQVRPPIRVLVLVVPAVAVSFWLLSPFLIDVEVSDEFVTSIAEAQGEVGKDDRDEGQGRDLRGGDAGSGEEGASAPVGPTTKPAPPALSDPGSPTSNPPGDPVSPTSNTPVAVTAPRSVSGEPSPAPATTSTTVPNVVVDPPPVVPAGPRLLGAGSLSGLAGHSGTGQAGFFELPDGSLVLRLEQFNIQNGPDLHLYVIPGAGATLPTDSSLYLGQLRGNVGDQTYELPRGSITPGDWTVLIWCKPFRVEFVGGTVSVLAS